MQSGVPVEERIYKGTVDCAKKVFEAEGELNWIKSKILNLFLQ